MEEEKKKEVEVEEDEDIDLEDLEEEEEEEEEESKPKEQQDKEERARQAKARREREAKEREEREKRIQDEAYLKGQLDSLKVNKFTNEPIEDEFDLKIYNLQKELEKDGKDPIADLPKKLAELDRKASIKAKEEASAKQKQDEAIDKDISDFRKKYPDVNLAQLLKDPDFADYSDGRIGIKGGKSLAEVYEAYNKFVSKFKKVEEEEDGKKPAPSPNGGRKKEKTSYSNMTEAQKIEELKKQGLI